AAVRTLHAGAGAGAPGAALQADAGPARADPSAHGRYRAAAGRNSRGGGGAVGHHDLTPRRPRNVRRGGDHTASPPPAPSPLLARHPSGEPRTLASLPFHDGSVRRIPSPPAVGRGGTR